MRFLTSINHKSLRNLEVVSTVLDFELISKPIKTLGNM